MEFEVGDRVILKSKEELEYPSMKGQENGVGIITALKPERDSNWCYVRWEDKSFNNYRYKGPTVDLIKYKEEVPMSRTIPTKEQVLKAASKCPQTKDALKILFPQDFEGEFDWSDFHEHPFKYLKIDGDDHIIPSEKLNEAFYSIGKPIPWELFPWTYLSTVTQLFQFLNENRKKD